MKVSKLVVVCLLGLFICSIISNVTATPTTDITENKNILKLESKKEIIYDLIEEWILLKKYFPIHKTIHMQVNDIKTLSFPVNYIIKVDRNYLNVEKYNTSGNKSDYTLKALKKGKTKIQVKRSTKNKNGKETIFKTYNIPVIIE